MNTTELFTAEELRELFKLCDEATPGPWWKHGGGFYCGISSEKVRERGLVAHNVIAPDAAFIAAARLALPKLITEVFGLRSEAERLRTENAALAFDLAAAQRTIETQKVIVVKAEELVSAVLKDNERIVFDNAQLRADLTAHRKAQEQAAK